MVYSYLKKNIKDVLSYDVLSKMVDDQVSQLCSVIKPLKEIGNCKDDVELKRIQYDIENNLFIKIERSDSAFRSEMYSNDCWNLNNIESVLNEMRSELSMILKKRSYNKCKVSVCRVEDLEQIVLKVVLETLSSVNTGRYYGGMEDNIGRKTDEDLEMKVRRSVLVDVITRNLFYNYEDPDMLEETNELSKTMKKYVGFANKIIELFVKHNLVNLESVRVKVRTYSYIKFDPLFWCKEYVRRYIYLPPMVTPPLDWEERGMSIFNGGYLTNDETRAIHLVNLTLNWKLNMKNKELLTRLNSLHKIKYRINKDILNDVINNPLKYNIDLEAFKELEKLNSEYKKKKNEMDKWDRKVFWAKIEKETKKVQELRKQILILSIAYIYKDNDLYFPWFICFRGRAYCRGWPLNPQGDGLSRVLLNPVGYHGKKYLNEEMTEAEKQKMIDVIDYKKSKGCDFWEEKELNYYELTNYECNHKIGIDVSCSAFQMVGLLLGSEKLLELTRFKAVSKDSDNGMDIYKIFSDEMYRLNKITCDRSTIKSVVMKYVYNEGVWARINNLLGTNLYLDEEEEEQMEEEILKKRLKNKIYNNLKGQVKNKSHIEVEKELNYIKSTKFAKSIDEIALKLFPEIVAFKKIIYDFATTLASENKYVHLPLLPRLGGLSQKYFKMLSKTFYVYKGKEKRRVVLRVPQDNPSKSKYGRATMPNMIHCADASIMWIVQERCYNENIVMFPIHDCFYVQAKDILKVQQFYWEACKEYFIDNDFWQLFKNLNNLNKNEIKVVNIFIKKYVKKQKLIDIFKDKPHPFILG